MSTSIYEYPCNERIRSFLRLEYLFDRLFLFEQQQGAAQEMVLLSVLFELMEVCERGDIKSTLLQEMDAQKLSLEQYRSYSDVDQATIDEVQGSLDKCYLDLHGAGKLGQAARESEWLLKVKSRYLIVGGASPIEFPQFHAWLVSDITVRKKLYKQWIDSFLPLYNALKEVLGLIRMAGETEHVSTGADGMYSRKLEGVSFQLIRVWLPPEHNIYPEISANKHISYVRILQLTEAFESRCPKSSIDFKIAFCKF